MNSLSYSAQLVTTHDRDRYLSALFVPAAEREGLLALYALNAELAQVRQAVHEEVLGHIRLAWWQEAVEALYQGNIRRGQPVIEALTTLVAQLPVEALIPLFERYRISFPEPPQGVEKLMDELSIRLLPPVVQAGWYRARGVIERHRRRYGKRGNSWLALKLLVTGMR